MHSLKVNAEKVHHHNWEKKIRKENNQDNKTITVIQSQPELLFYGHISNIQNKLNTKRKLVTYIRRNSGSKDNELPVQTVCKYVTSNPEIVIPAASSRPKLDSFLTHSKNTDLYFPSNYRTSTPNTGATRTLQYMKTNKNINFSYSKSDVTELYKFVQDFFKDMHHLLHQNVDEDESIKGISFILAVDLKKTQRNRIINTTINKQATKANRLNQSHIIATDKNSFNLSHMRQIINEPKILNIPIKHQIMKFKLTISKFNSISNDFFKFLATIYYKSNKLFTKSSLNVPSLCVRNWHFRNITQGYLLRNLLKHTNTNTLNFMRKLYFVIITTNTPNINIEINFYMKNGIFMVYDTNPLNYFSREVDWENEYKSIITKSSSSKTIKNMISYIRQTMSDTEIYKQSLQDQISGDSEINETVSITTYNCDSTSNQSLPEISAVTGKKSAATSYILSLEDVLKPKEILTADKAVGDIVISSAYNRKSSIYQYFTLYKSLLGKLMGIPMTNFNICLFKNGYVDETIFERISIDKYVIKTKTPRFYTMFLKCFGHTVGCTLFSFLISLI